MTDGVGDQLYKPNKARIRQDHYTAIAATWGVRLTKSGNLFMTGYRTGNKGNCGHDSTGWKLFARSATRCAYNGDSYLQILRIYYGPVAVINGGGSGGGAADGFSSLNIQTAPYSSEPDTSSPDTSSPDTTSPAVTDALPISAACGIGDGVGVGTSAAPALPGDVTPSGCPRRRHAGPGGPRGRDAWQLDSGQRHSRRGHSDRRPSVYGGLTAPYHHGLTRFKQFVDLTEVD